MRDTVKFEKGNVKMIAHRGLSGLECENTAAAFVAAGNRSYFGIETDLHITADGAFVLLHDASTARVAGGVDLNVEKLPLSAADSLRLVDRIDGQTRRDLVLPTLDEYIRICRRYGKTAVLELKGRSNPEKYAEAVRRIKRLGYLGQTFFIAFGKQNLLDLRGILPDAKMQLLTSDWGKDTLAFLTAHRFDLDIEHKYLTPEIVSAVHGAGLELNCWTVNDPARAEALVQMGVDYITTNILE